MRVAMYYGRGAPVTIEEVPDPRPQPNEVILRIGRGGICGSDLSMTLGSQFDYPVGPGGLPMGHEYAGEVLEVGRDVVDVKVGDRVASMGWKNCGKCENCLQNRSILCTSILPYSGGLGDYIAVDKGGVFRMPERLTMAEGALVEPMSSGLRGLRQAGLRGGERVVVLGLGGTALAVVYWARVLGAGQIVVVARSTRYRDIAAAMGADEVIEFDPDDPASLAHLAPADIAAECIGKPGMIARAVDIVRPGGVVLSLGMCHHSEPLIPAYCTFKEVRVVFSLGFSVAEFQETLQTFASGHVHPDVMVSDVIGLDALPEQLESMRAGGGPLKVQVDPSVDRH